MIIIQDPRIRRSMHRLKQSVSAPGVGKIAFLPPLSETQSLATWEERVRAGAPNTPPEWTSSRFACPEGDDCPREGIFVLATFGIGSHVGLEDAHLWAARYSLQATTVSTCLALAHAYPLLRTDMRIFDATPPVTLVAPTVYQHEGERSVFRILADAGPRTAECAWAGYGFSDQHWFVFMAPLAE